MGYCGAVPLVLPRGKLGGSLRISARTPALREAVLGTGLQQPAPQLQAGGLQETGAGAGRTVLHRHCPERGTT